jgi:hypothetical protein
MSTISGLPAHVLLVHFIVVLAPLTAIGAVACALWPAARRRLVWPVAALAVLCLVVTPLTTEAGEWLEPRLGKSPALHTHTELGDTMIYFSLALAVAAALLVFLHLRLGRGRSLNQIVAALISVLVVIASVATVVQVYRIGDSGARSAWGDVASNK